MITAPPKDPAEVLDYKLNWVARLGTDTILTSTWVVPTGLTQPNAASFTSNTTTVWLGSGILGTIYAVKNTITTAGLRTMDQTFNLSIAAK